MNKDLHVGISAETAFRVERKHLANEIGSGMVSVLSTAMMIAGMEAAAVKAVQPYLETGHTTVGFHVDVWHKAPTPEGGHARFIATLEEISQNGKRFKFKIEAWDAAGLIGEGLHERALVRKEDFENSALSRKRADS